MARLYFIIILLFSCSVSNSQFRGTYKQGDTLNVLTLSGLNLRESPSSSSNRIATVSYGSKAQVIDDNLRETSYQIEEVKGLLVKGYWIKVKVKEHVGYLFDGYLSKLPAPNYKDTTLYENGFLVEFLKTHFKMIGPKRNVVKYEDCEVSKEYNCICAFEQTFENGFYSENTCPESGTDNVLKIKGASLVEMFLLAKALVQNVEVWFFGLETQYKNSTKTIELNSIGDGAGCWGKVELKGDYGIFSWGCGC